MDIVKDSGGWERIGKRKMLRLFHLAAEKVPAYRDFLNKSKIDPKKIKTFADFQAVPPVDKNNYLRAYPLEMLSCGGSLVKPLVFTSTSGSTGQPCYLYRDENLERQYSVILEKFFRNNKLMLEDPTLVIVAFGLGVWIGGVITYDALYALNRRFPFASSILATSIDKEQIIKALRELSPNYKQTILIGYPPFIKDIIDEARAENIHLNKLHLRLIFAAEPFTEDFRDYLVEHAAISNLYVDTMNIYGSAELGAMAFETPPAIMIRRLARHRPEVFKGLFGDLVKTPTLAQYIPLHINFEAVNGSILVTGDGALPLVRYSIGDHGGVYSFREMNERLAAEGVDLKKEMRVAGLSPYWQELPFVYVYERADFSTTLYGLQVYPEPIREALLKKPLSHYLTGKLVLETQFDSQQDQHLYIHLEMRKNRAVPPSIKKAILKRIVDRLEQKNSAYRELHKFLGRRALPLLTFWFAEDPHYFKPGIKQKWVKKTLGIIQ